MISGDGLPTRPVYERDRLSGYLACELTTASPMYVRGGVRPERFLSQAEPDPQFFYIDQEEQPVIPGSSLRGMLRALVEIAAYSKISAVTDQRLVYRAVGDVTTHGKRYREQLMQEDREKYFTPLIIGGYMAQESGGRRPAQRPDHRGIVSGREEDVIPAFQSSAGVHRIS